MQFLTFARQQSIRIIMLIAAAAILALITKIIAERSRQFDQTIPPRLPVISELLENRILNKTPEVEEKTYTEDAWDTVDEASYESFPASDPPAWIQQRI